MVRPCLFVHILSMICYTIVNEQDQLTHIILEDTMKKLSISLALVLVLAVMVSSIAMAAPGGAPAAHGVSGRDFGAAVSGLAQSAPGALAEHTSGGMAGGMPDAHGVDGRTFGSAVSTLAQSAPGAVGSHASGR
jgi:hypothetical protein